MSDFDKNEDDELERLKAKRLAEMQKNVEMKKKHEESLKSQQTKKTTNPRDIVVRNLGYRGLEVLEAAESQFPHEARLVVEKLAELLQSGEVQERIDGGQLLSLFRAIGLHLRLDTAIKVEKDGKFVSLSDKISGKMRDEEE